MVEVVTLDSDDEPDSITLNNTLYYSLISHVRHLTQGDQVYSQLLSTLHEVKVGCAESYIASSRFKQHIAECSQGLSNETVLAKLESFASKLSVYSDGRHKQPPHKRRRLDPPMSPTESILSTGSTTAPAISVETSNLLHSNPVFWRTMPPNTPLPIPVNVIQLPIKPVVQNYTTSTYEAVTDTVTDPPAPSNTENIEHRAQLFINKNIEHHQSIVTSLTQIQSCFSDDREVVEVIRIFLDHILSLNLGAKNVSVSSIDTYCCMLLKVKLPLSLLFHIRRLLTMSYFADMNPVYIAPADWFADPEQIVKFHLSDFVMLELFKRLLYRVLPDSKKNMVDLFTKKFRSAAHKEKKLVLDRILKLKLVDNEKTINNKSYAATLLCCLGDSMEIFIKAKVGSQLSGPGSRPGSGSGSRSESRESTPLIIDIVEDNPCESSPGVPVSRSRESSSDQNKSSLYDDKARSRAGVSSPLLAQEIIAFPTHVDISDHSEDEISVTECDSTDQKEQTTDENGDDEEAGVRSEVKGADDNSSDKETEVDCNAAEKEGETSKSTELEAETATIKITGTYDGNMYVNALERIFGATETDDNSSDKETEVDCNAAEKEGETSKSAELEAETAIIKMTGTYDGNIYVNTLERIFGATETEDLPKSSDETVTATVKDKPHGDDVNNYLNELELIPVTPTMETSLDVFSNQEDHVSSSVKQLQSDDTSAKADADKTNTLQSDAVESIDPGNEREEEEDNTNMDDKPVKRTLIEVNSEITNNKEENTGIDDEPELAESSNTDETEGVSKDCPDRTEGISKDCPDEGDQINLASSTQELFDPPATEHGGLLIEDERHPRSSSISFSQKSVEFINEVSPDCVITSVKPANVQYVEITLHSQGTYSSGMSDKAGVEEVRDAPAAGEGTVCQESEEEGNITITLSPPPKPVIKRVPLVAVAPAIKPSNNNPDVVVISKPGAFTLPAGPSRWGAGVGRIGNEAEEGRAGCSESEEDPDVDEATEDYKEKVKQVQKLSKKLVRLARRIKAVQEADIDCDEMDKWGNLYLQEEKLKKKHRNILRQLEEIQGDLNCHYHFNVKINCGIPKLSQFIEDRLNSRQKFPDIEDVRRLLERGLLDCGMTMKDNKMKTLAKQIFLDAGSQIQNHRKTELRLDGGFHLMDRVDLTKDPAKEDTDLRKKLKRNKNVAQKKLKGIQETFDAKQLAREFLDNEIFDDGSGEKEREKERENNPTIGEENLEEMKSKSENIKGDSGNSERKSESEKMESDTDTSERKSENDKMESDTDNSERKSENDKMECDTDNSGSENSGDDESDDVTEIGLPAGL